MSEKIYVIEDNDGCVTDNDDDYGVCIVKMFVITLQYMMIM